MKKKNRIRKKEEFQKLIHGAKKNINPSVPKKIGKAVKRNLYKRQVRMMLEKIINFTDYPYDIVIIIRFAYPNKSFEENQKLLERSLIKDII